MADGSTVDEQLTVVGAERLFTPAGTFDCWKTYQTDVRSDGSTDNYTIWLAPQLGDMVQETDTTMNSDGTSYTYTATLQSTDVPTGPVPEAKAGPMKYLNCPSLK